MNQVTELKMAIDATFSSILSEIQLSNLNFNLQITPYAAYITLKKSVITDQNGIKAVPAPPILFLLQQAHQKIAELQEENKGLKVKMHENAMLVEAIDASNNTLAASNAAKDTLQTKLEAAEEEIIKVSSLKNSFEANLKDTKKMHLQDMNKANTTIKSLEKRGKGLEKEIHNLRRNLESSRDTLKNLKSDHSSLKISKAKLEAEKRKLEKLFNQREFKIAKLNKKDTDINRNPLKHSSSPSDKLETIPSSISSSSGPVYTSMIAHWNPLPVEISLMPNSLVTMVTHITTNLPPPSFSFWSAEEYQEMIDKMCERVFSKLGWDKLIN